MDVYDIIGPLGMFCLLLLTLYAARFAGQDGIFGKTTSNIREQRIVRVSLSIGLILGVGFPRDFWGALFFTLGVVVLTITTVAQITWPNKTPDGEETIS